MPLKLVACKGCTVSITSEGFSGLCTITSLPDIRCKMKTGPIENGIYAGDMTVSVTGVTSADIINGTGIGVISGSAENLTLGDLPAVRLGDSVSLTVYGFEPANPSVATTADIDIEVTDAGQSHLSSW